MSESKVLVLSKDEHILLKGLIPEILKNSESSIKSEKNPIKKKGLKVSSDILNGFLQKLNKINF